MSRRSSVRGDVLHIKTDMGLGRFEVGKTRNSYDVPFRSYSIAFEKKQKLRSWPMRVEHYGRKFSHSYDVLFRSCLGNSRCRAVNSISKATIYCNVNKMTQSVTSTKPPKVSTPFLPGSEKSEVKSKSSFKSAENRAASSLGVGGHRYTSFKCGSKLLWV